MEGEEGGEGDLRGDVEEINEPLGKRSWRARRGWGSGGNLQGDVEEITEPLGKRTKRKETPGNIREQGMHLVIE